MRLLLLCIFLVGCAGKPPNDEIGFTDGPAHANFTYMVTGTDFSVDNVGHNYTLHGQNLNYDQMRALFFYVSPWTWADMKQFFLNYCHANPNVCDYAKVQKRFTVVEDAAKAKMSPDNRAIFESILAEKQPLL